MLLGLIAAAWGWWEARSWRPDEAEWPDQGALVGARDGAVAFATLRGLGANFVYLEASEGARTQDRAFPDNVAAARQAGLRSEAPGSSPVTGISGTCSASLHATCG